MSDTPNMDRVQAEFLKAITKNGMVHTFEWMADWFNQVAKAQVNDELLRVLGDDVGNADMRGLQAMEMMMPLAKSASNFSTSPTKNLMEQARLAALAEIVDTRFEGIPITGYGSRVHRGRQWEQLLVDAAKEKSAQDTAKLG